MRALIYARFSTTLQSALSIDDQVRVCTGLVERQGWSLAGVHCDAAVSGAVRDRPGLNALLAAVEAGQADVIVAESLDRVSRDQEDIAGIHKRVRYRGAVIWTLSEGEIGELHVGLRGTMAAMMRKDTADKVRRGLTGRALAGRNPGGMAYGYRKVPRFDDRGEQVRGLRAVDPDQADVIRRIFALTAQGWSARAIAAALNAEGVRGPAGGPWRASSIAGDARRRNGILQNDLYRGRLLYNRTRRVYRPGDHHREVRLNDEAEWLSADVPDLRIVSDAEWDAAQAARARFTGARPEQARRPKRLLSGKLVCGSCGGTYIVQGGGRWGCGRHFDGRLCGNGRTITNDVLERRVLQGLEGKLLDPDAVAIWVDEYRRNRAARLASAARAKGKLERRRADAQRRIDRLVAAIADGVLDAPTARSALDAAKADVAGCDAGLAELESEKVVALHPGLAGDYRRRVGKLIAALDGDDAHESRTTLRALIDRVVISANPEGRGTIVEVEGTLPNLLALAAGAPVDCPVTLVPLERHGRYRTLLKVAV